MIGVRRIAGTKHIYVTGLVIRRRGLYLPLSLRKGRSMMDIHVYDRRRFKRALRKRRKQ